MLDYIQKLQQRPEKERKKVSLIVSSTVTGLIAVVWLTATLSVPDTIVVQGKEIPETQASTPLSALAKDVKSGFKSVSESIKELNTSIKTLPEELSAASTSVESVDDETSTEVNEDAVTSYETDQDSLEIIEVYADDPEYPSNYSSNDNSQDLTEQ